MWVCVGVGGGGRGGIALTFQIKLFKFKSKSSYRFSSHSFSNFCPSLPPSLRESGLLLTDLHRRSPSSSSSTSTTSLSPFPSSLLAPFFLLRSPPLHYTFERLAVWRTALLRAFFKSGTSKESWLLQYHVDSCARKKEKKKSFSYLNTHAHMHTDTFTCQTIIQTWGCNHTMLVLSGLVLVFPPTKNAEIIEKMKLFQTEAFKVSLVSSGPSVASVVGAVCPEWSVLNGPCWRLFGSFSGQSWWRSLSLAAQCCRPVALVSVVSFCPHSYPLPAPFSTFHIGQIQG